MVFKKIFEEDFEVDATSVEFDSKYGADWSGPFEGVKFNKENFYVLNSVAHLLFNDKSGQWKGSGIGHIPAQIYGKWAVRARAVETGGRVVALLWPTYGWPPEIDFMESGDSYRDHTTQTLHYDVLSTPAHENKMVHNSYDVDMTKWHTYGVEWTPGKLVYKLDGVEKGSVVGDFVPNQPMHIHLQCAVGSNTHKPCELEVDWVRVFSYA